MSSLYTALIIPPPGQDLPPALPGGTIVIPLPVTADGFNAAAFYGMAKGLADYIDYIMQTAKIRPGLASGSVPGFTTPSHTGTGGGAVTIAAPSPTIAQTSGGPRSVVILITTGGLSNGTAQFKWSNDGGNSYGSAIAVPNGGGNYQDPTSGITVNFSNATYQLNDYWSFQPTDTPLAQYPGGDGKLRFSIDHMGFPSGRIVTIDENWDVAWSIAAGTARAPITADPRWNATTTATRPTIARTDPSLSPFYPYVKLTPGTQAADACQLDSERQFSGGFTGLAAKQEFEFSMSVIGANLITWQIGLANNGSGLSQALFSKTSAQTNWQWTLTDGGNNTFGADTGIPPVAGTMQRFRIELYASGTPLGRLVRFFINEQLVAQQVPTNDYGITGQYFNGTCTGAAASFGQLGPTRLCYGRFLDAPVL